VLLLIEVSDSTLRYDLGKRASLYAAHGIPEYWVFDLQHDRVWRHRAPKGPEYTQRDEVTEGKLTLPTLGAELDLAELF
jgi:Uma2 family endonuclease